MFQNQKDADRYMKHIHNNSENFEYYNGAFFTCKGKNGKTTNRLDDDKANGFYYIGKTDRKLHFCSVKEIKNNFPDDFIRENVYSKNSSYYFSTQLSIILEACGFKNNNDLIEGCLSEMDTKTDDKYILAERYNLRQYYNRINERSSLKEEHYCRANEKTGLISYISKSLDTETHKIYTKKSMILITRKQQKQMLLF